MEEVQGWATKAQNKVDIMEAEEEARAQRRSYTIDCILDVKIQFATYQARITAIPYTCNYQAESQSTQAAL
jgi:hypothetical protein